MCNLAHFTMFSFRTLYSSAVVELYTVAHNFSVRWVMLSSHVRPTYTYQRGEITCRKKVPKDYSIHEQKIQLD